jgi:hypothetical protein
MCATGSPLAVHPPAQASGRLPGAPEGNASGRQRQTLVKYGRASRVQWQAAGRVVGAEAMKPLLPVLPVLPLLLCALAGLSWSRNAQACSRPAPSEFSIDPALARLDVEPPGAPRAVSGLASRTSGTFCKGEVCTVNTCGSEAYLQLEFEPAPVERSAPGDLGYRLRFLEGVVPPELAAPLQRVFSGVPPLRVSVPEGFDAVVALDASFELVAVDSAGNESPGSEPFRLAFNACTRVPDQGGCVEDRAGRVTCSAGSCVEAASESGCGLAPRRSPVGVSCGASVVALGLLLRRRRSVTPA